MENKQLLPFERNRYYSGKMLTSTDFIAEQLYMNNKRRFMNNILFGSGVLCGLNVLSLDDLSILLESGVAIDNTGREIVVDSTSVKKLSTIEGFENIKSDHVILYLKYKEKEVHPVYCSDIGENGKEYEYNRIDEGYTLFIKDARESDYLPELVRNKFILKEVLVDNDDFYVAVQVPSVVPKGSAVKLVLTANRKSEGEGKIALQAKLDLPSFTDSNGEHEVTIAIEETTLTQGQTISKNFWFNCEPTDAEETNILIKKENVKTSIDGYSYEVAKDSIFKVKLTNDDAFTLSVKEVAKSNLDEEDEFTEEAVPLAHIVLIRTDSTYIISKVIENGIKHYIATPNNTLLRHKYQSFFKEEIKAGNTNLNIPNAARETQNTQYRLPTFMSSGRVEIPLKVNMKKGDICYSEEIMHGLGKGNVYVSVGIEHLESGVTDNRKSKTTVYGKSALFAEPDDMEIEMAVKVMNDRGSFQIAAQLLGEQNSIVIQANWVAIKFDNIRDEAEMQEEDGRCLVPETPTVRLKAKESYFFNIGFKNMEPCRLSYELTESGSGEIGSDGVYVAPAKEGVYEIYIYCTDMPKISTYVYAIVSK